MEKLLRAARGGRLRPDRRRHAADPPRARLPRRAAAPHPAARQPDLPVADDADPGVVPGRRRRGAGVPPHRLQGRRHRGRRRRRGVLPGVRGHGGGVPRAGQQRARAARRPPTALRARHLAPAATRSRRRRSSPSGSRTSDIPVDALIVNRVHPRFGEHVASPAPGPGGRAPGRRTTAAGAGSPRCTTTSPTSAQVAERERRHLAGVKARVGPRRGRLRAVPRARRLRLRRARPRSAATSSPASSVGRRVALPPRMTILVAADARWVRDQVRTAFVGPGQRGDRGRPAGRTSARP